ncbi:hypothetical protein [Streptomyces sp. NBC_00344]|uniref:hypothetical protein n=1 Tax=Streptomyces sp. NBC_00344 TaxID=2975720 RepID=UPI002E1C71E9
MHADMYLQLHRERTAELHRQAAEYARAPHPHRIRHQLGWTLVELGLRLTLPEPRRRARIA